MVFSIGIFSSRLAVRALVRWEQGNLDGTFLQAGSQKRKTPERHLLEFVAQKHPEK
jgi:hypothetical protein